MLPGYGSLALAVLLSHLLTLALLLSDYGILALQTLDMLELRPVLLSPVTVAEQLDRREVLDQIRGPVVVQRRSREAQQAGMIRMDILLNGKVGGERRNAMIRMR